MPLNETLQEIYEDFEANVRKLDQLISQLELWSDEYTVNHKKEEVRLPEYMELHLNLEAFKEELTKQMQELSQEDSLKDALAQAKAHIEERLAAYKATEEVIHDWVRAIKNPYMLINNIKVLQENKAYIESIINPS